MLAPQSNLFTVVVCKGPSVFCWNWWTSLGDGMLFVTTSQVFTIGSNKGGDIIAFGLPSLTSGTEGHQTS
jgi:ABC-type anion transport system duplicated permease subunit